MATVTPQASRQADIAKRPGPLVDRHLPVQDDSAGWSGQPGFVDQLAVDALRHAAALKPLRREDFAGSVGCPSAAHFTAVNELIRTLRLLAIESAREVRRGADAHQVGRTRTQAINAIIANRRALKLTRFAETVWEFYLEMFSQRTGQLGLMLQAADRIAVDCYEAVYVNLATARSVPTPAPLSRLDSHRSPSTLRRGVRNPWLKATPNPFPIVSLPYHRLVNPWSLGAIHHEVAHNIQADLGLWEVVPRRLATRLAAAGLDRPAVAQWVRWHKEVWADLAGVLLGGPTVVRSLLDVLSKPPERAAHHKRGTLHPTPVIRVALNVELLRRIQFGPDGDDIERLWARLYPRRDWRMPVHLRATASTAIEVVVDEICFSAYPELGSRTLAEVIRFRPEHRLMAREAAQRLAAGTDPGIIPPRFLVAAVRWALHLQLARSNRLAKNFYSATGER